MNNFTNTYILAFSASLLLRHFRNQAVVFQKYPLQQAGSKTHKQNWSYKLGLNLTRFNNLNFDTFKNICCFSGLCFKTTFQKLLYHLASCLYRFKTLQSCQEVKIEVVFLTFEPSHNCIIGRGIRNHFIISGLSFLTGLPNMEHQQFKPFCIIFHFGCEGVEAKMLSACMVV